MPPGYGYEYQPAPEDPYSQYDPQQWQQMEMQRMQGQMPGPGRYGQMGSSDVPEGYGPLWQSRDARFYAQSQNGRVNAFASHYPGGPTHHIENLRRMPPSQQMQYLRYQQQFQPLPSGTPYVRPYRVYPHTWQWYGEGSGPRPYTYGGYGRQQPMQQQGYGPYSPRSYAYAGYGERQPVQQLGYGPETPQQPYGYGPQQGPAFDPRGYRGLNAAQRARREGGQLEGWSPEVQEMSGSQLVEVIRSLTVMGQPIAADGVTANFGPRNGIPPSRIAEHAASLQEMAQRLEQGLQQAGWRPGSFRVSSDGITIRADAGGRSMVATRTQLLLGNGVRNGMWQSVTDGSQVRWSAGASRDEFLIDGPSGSYRVVELRDGRTVREQFDGRSGMPVATMLYDGDPNNPSLVRVNGNGARVTVNGQSVDLRHGMHVMGERGPVSLYRPGNPQEADSFLREAAQRLRTPEAIGSFVSSYFSWEDSVARGGRRITTASTVNFQSERAGMQYIQSPFETISWGRGDCEDFAVLASTLCTMAGIPNLVARKTSNHYGCVFLERVANGYILCTIDTGGFARKPQVYPTAAQAMAMVWSGGGSAVHWELQTGGLSPEAQARAQQVVAAGGGLSVIDVTTVSGGRAATAFLPFEGTDWDRLVYHRG